MKHAPIHVTLYHGAKRSKPTRQDDFEGGWPEFVENLQGLIGLPPNAPADAPRPEAKQHFIAWAPHKLSMPHRSKANVEAVTLLAIDVDTCNLVDLCDNLEAKGWTALIYGSPGDSEERPTDQRRVRVISPISRHLGPEESELARYAYAECLGLAPGCGVDGTADCSRIYFIGTFEGDAERIWAEAEGTAVDVDKLLARKLEHNWSGERLSTQTPNDGGTTPEYNEDSYMRAARGIAQNCGGGVEFVNGHQALYHVLIEVSKALGPTRIHDIKRVVLEEWNPRCVPPFPENELLRRIDGTDGRKAINIVKSDPLGFREVRKEVERAAAEADARLAEPNLPDGAERDELGTDDVDWSTGPEPLRYLCEGLGIGWIDKCVGVHGYAASGKSPFLNYMALCIAAGLPILGREVKRTPVIYCDAESPRLAARRIKRIAKALKIDLAKLKAEGWWTFRRVTGDLTTMLSTGAIERACQSTDKGWGVALMFDSYSSLIRGVNENDSTYADALWELGQKAFEYNAVPIVLFHQRKSDRRAESQGDPLEGVSGTNRLPSAFTSSIFIARDAEDDKCITIRCSRAPEERFDEIAFRWLDTPDGGLLPDCQLTKPKLSREEKAQAKAADKFREKQGTVSKNADRVEAFLINAPMPVKRGAITDALGLSGDSWGDARAEVLRRQHVIEFVAGKNATYRINPDKRDALIGQRAGFPYKPNSRLAGAESKVATTPDNRRPPSKAPAPTGPVLTARAKVSNPGQLKRQATVAPPGTTPPG